MLHHTTDADNYILQLLASGAQTHQHLRSTASETDAVPAGTFISSMLKDPVTKQIVGVNLSQPLNSADPSKHVYTFNRPVTDPIATAIASVWYSWANYYATTVTSTPAMNVPGNIGAGSNILILTNADFGARARHGGDRCARHFTRRDHRRCQ